MALAVKCLSPYPVHRAGLLVPALELSLLYLLALPAVLLRPLPLYPKLEKQELVLLENV